MISKDVYTLIAVVCDDGMEEEDAEDHYIVRCCPEHQRLNVSLNNCIEDENPNENFIPPRNVLHHKSLTMIGAKKIQRKHISDFKNNLGCRKENKTLFVDSILTNGHFISSSSRLSTQPYFCVDKVKEYKDSKSSSWIAIVCQEALVNGNSTNRNTANNVYNCLHSYANILR